ncbi:ATP-dependent DNA helicase [Halobacteriales archaeon QS_8_69_26]|nr:MAG: ATP-dependent DNA helicase [Halobacteriales archaeon QS_8_69_26]
MIDPNDQQRELIETTEGVTLVDAGAGTGKTFAVTRRYANIVDQADVEPDDVLLVTFTNNAAAEMKERIVDHSAYGIRELADAPIQTFHSFCNDLLQDYGHEAPTHLGIDDRITGSTRIIKEELVETALFREFVDRFGDHHPEYDDFFRVLSDPTVLLGLINQLAAKGVFPTAEGWYRDGERHLDGDFAAFERLFAAANEPRGGGSRQSSLRKKLNRYRKNKCYLPEAPKKGEIRGSGKQIPEEVARWVFEKDREALKRFVHDVYFEYLRFALRRNYFNFGFLQLFAFVLLCEDHELREEVAFEYVMVDEFQDTSEIQFKLALLLAGTDNVCVVGDWKQSIFSFQYADVRNITQFETRLRRFRDQLNDDHERVGLDPSVDTEIELVENYRSTQTILDFSETTLTVPASSKDDVKEDDLLAEIDPLNANTDHDTTRIEAIQHEDEHEAVLTKIQEIVGNDDYLIEDEEGNPQRPEYGDIAVFTRTRDYGREILQVARDHDFPMAYEGGIELFRTDQAKLLLAWLRILEHDSERGWAVVLERAGYTLDEVDHLLETEAYPEAMLSFRDELAAMDTVGGIAERVFARYGYDGSDADAVLATIQEMHNTTTLTRGDLIRFIERGIESGATREVHADAGTNSVTVQTIHAAKGLEYPIVILANMNGGKFPPRGGGSATISYQDPVGLRRRKRYAEAHGLPHVYDNWRMDVLRHCLPDDYDEERRLLYVASTRAEHHLVFAAGEEPNTFLEELDVGIETCEPDVGESVVDTTEQTALQVTIPTPEGPVGHTPHTLMNDDVFEEVTEGRGREFGTQVHDFAEAYARGEGVTPDGEDQEHVATFLDSLSGDLLVEEDAYLPLEVDGERVTVSGIVDLVHVLPDRVEVVDYKTDLSRIAESEYRKQLSVYHHVAREVYPDREITASVFYTADGKRREIDPMSIDELREQVRRVEAGQG